MAGADVTKIVELAVKVTGIDKSAFAPLLGVFKTINKAVSDTKKQVDDLQSSLSKLKAPPKAAETIKKLGTAASEASKGVSNLADDLKKSESRLSKFGKRVSTVFQYKAILLGMKAVENSITGTISSIMEYDQALKDLEAITRSSSLAVVQMGEKIIDVAMKTKFSASEVAAGMRMIVQAGFTAAEAIGTMQAVSDLATGTLTDISSTVDLVTTTMRVFALEATASGSVVDTFANAVNRSKLTVDKLRVAMNYVGPIAKEAGISFQELSSAMGVLANSGLKASTIGTGLRRVFAELVDPSKKLKRAVREAGISLADLDPQTNSLNHVLNSLKLVLVDTQTAFDLFGKRGAAAALSLARAEGSGGFATMLKTVQESGTAAEMAATQMEGLAVSWKNVQDRLGVLAVKIGELGITDVLRGIVEISKTVISTLTILIDNPIARFIGKVGILTLALGGFMLAWIPIAKALFAAIALFKGFAISAGTAAMATLTMKPALDKLTASFATLNASMGIFAIAIIAIYTAFKAFQSYSNFFKKQSDEASKAADNFNNLSKSVLNYKLAINDLDKGSDEYAAKNKALRKELLGVANSMNEVSIEASAAAMAINPVTGAIEEGSTALEDYQTALDDITISKLAEAVQAAGDQLERSTNLFNRTTSSVAEGFIVVGKGLSVLYGVLKDLSTIDLNPSAESVSNFASQLTNILPVRVLNKTVGIFKTLKKEAFGYYKIAKEAERFSKRIATDPTLTYKEISKWIKTNIDDTKDLTFHQKEIYEGFKAINSKVTAYVAHLESIGRLDLARTTEGIQQLGEESGFTGLKLKGLVSILEDLRIRNENIANNIIDKWKMDKKPDFFVNLIAGYEEYAGTISDADKILLASYDKKKQIHIEELALIDRETNKRLTNNTATEEFLDNQERKRNNRIKAAESTRTDISKDALAQRMTLIGSEIDKRSAIIADIEEKYAQGSIARAKRKSKAIIESEKRIRAILEKGVEDQSTKKAAKLQYQQSLQEEENAYRKSLANIAAMERDKEITTEVAESKAMVAKEFYFRKAVALAKDYRDKVDPLLEPNDYKERNLEVLRQQEKLYKAKESNAKKSSKTLKGLEKVEVGGTIKSATFGLKREFENQKSLYKAQLTDLESMHKRDLITHADYWANRKALAEFNHIDMQVLLNKRIDLLKNAEQFDLALADSEKTRREITLDYDEKIKVATNELNDAKKDYINTTIELNDAEDKSSKNTKQTLEDLEKTGTALENIKGGMKKAIGETITWNGILQDLGETAVSSFSDGLVSGLRSIADHTKSAKEAFKDFAQSFLLDIAAMITKALILKTIQSALGGTGIGAFLGFSEGGEIPKKADGGTIPGSSPHSKADNILMWGTAGEYMQPVRAVQHYGIAAMEAIRTLRIPKSALNSFASGMSSYARPSYALASGGPVPSKNMPLSPSIFEVNTPVQIDSSAKAEDIARKLPSIIEDVVIKVLQKELR